MKVKVNPKVFAYGFGLFLLCLVIRLIGIQWGLPNDFRHHALHPDEEVVWSYSQSIEPAKLKFTPGFYNYGTLYLTMERVVTDVISGYGGGPKEKDGSDVHLAIGRFILGGRILSAIAGAMTALLVYLMLIPRTHILGAIMGGLAMGITPGFVVHSRFQTVDVIATCFLAASLYWTLRLIPGRVPQESEETEEPKPLDWAAVKKAAIWAGVFAGLSAGTKYTGVLAIVAFAVTAFVGLSASQREQGIHWKAIGLSAVACFGVFFLVTPGALLEAGQFWRDFQYEMTHTSTGHGMVFAGTAPGFVHHVSNLVIGYGGLLFLLSLFGLGRGLWRRHLWLVGPAALFLIVYFLIGRADVKFLRYTFPLLPVLALGFGWLMGQGHLNGKPKGRGVVLVGMLALAGMGGGFSSTVVLTQAMAGIDPRDSMGETIKKIVPEGMTVGLVSDPWFYSPTIYPEIQAHAPSQSSPRNMDAWRGRMAESEPQVVRYFPENPTERVDWDVRLITELQPDFIVMSSFETEGYALLERARNVPDEYVTEFGRFREFMKLLPEYYQEVDKVNIGNERLSLLSKDAAFIATQGVHDLMYVRPYLWLWKRKVDTPTQSNGSSTTSGQREAPVPTR